MDKLAIIGLDCVDPDLLASLLPELSTLRRLVEEGSLARLRSVDPPITIPAWMCMMTGKDPGELGVYGFRNRKDHSYIGLGIASSASFSGEPVWQTLAKGGHRSILLGIPGTFPPRPIAGKLVSGFLTPSTETTYTYPAALADDIRRWVGDYMFDVRGFRTEDKSWLLEQLHEMTTKRFEVARRLASERDWDFFAMVEIGPDRVHHGLWAHHDVSHPKHDPTSPFRQALTDYYRLLDGEIAKLLDAFPDSTQICVVSDHGVQRMEGGIGINEWLIREGYLTLKEYPATPTRMQDLIERGHVDWTRTRAWGEGGYYGRVFLNVAGREPDGTITPEECPDFRRELAAAIEAIPDEGGRSIGTRVLCPVQIYREVRGTPPDLLVYFGNLSWRSIGTVGWNCIHFHENDTGPDDANHAPDGIFLSAPSMVGGDSLSILAVRDLVLRHFGVEGD